MDGWYKASLLAVGTTIFFEVGLVAYKVNEKAVDAIAASFVQAAANFAAAVRSGTGTSAAIVCRKAPRCVQRKATYVTTIDAADASA